MNPSEIENTVFDTIADNTNDFSKMKPAIEMLYESFPEFPILKFFFYRISRLNLNEVESENLFENIVKHCAMLSAKLGYNINFYTGMMDYIVERNRLILNPVFIDIYLSEEMDKATYKDPLTSAYNREYFERALKAEINRSGRSKSFFSLLLIDIDKFALINNNYGYHAGNHILIEISDRLKRTLRAEDLIIRYFDDRFILLLPNTDIAGAKKLAERILSSLMKNVLRIESRIINVALSIGIIQYPDHGSDEKELMESLNKMRYRSKELGGNTIAVPQK